MVVGLFIYSGYSVTEYGTCLLQNSSKIMSTYVDVKKKKVAEIFLQNIFARQIFFLDNFANYVFHWLYSVQYSFTQILVKFK